MFGINLYRAVAIYAFCRVLPVISAENEAETGGVLLKGNRVVEEFFSCHGVKLGLVLCPIRFVHRTGNKSIILNHYKNSVQIAKVQRIIENRLKLKQKKLAYSTNTFSYLFCLKHYNHLSL